MIRKIVSAALVVGLAVVSPVNAEDIDDQPCTAPEHRQFDFWIGAWNVTTPDGTQAGTVNHLTSGSRVANMSIATDESYIDKSLVS